MLKFKDDEESWPPAERVIPENLRGRIPFARLVPTLRVPGASLRAEYFDDYRHHVEARWNAEFSARAGVVTNVEQHLIRFRHVCGRPTSPKTCIKCQQESGERPPVYSIHVDIERDVIPRRQVEKVIPARKHTQGRWQSEASHLRIQKKWEKRFPAHTILVTARESRRYALTKMVGKFIADLEASDIARDTKRTRLNNGFDDITAASLGIPE